MGVKAAWEIRGGYREDHDSAQSGPVVKGYAKHESETLTAVTEARAKVGSIKMDKTLLDDPKALSQFQQAQGGLSSALSRLMVVVEKYPDLKANQNFQDLQHQLEGTENRINVARTRFTRPLELLKFYPGPPKQLTNSLLLNLS